MSDYLVGDIHGCHTKLRNALDEVRFNPEKDALYSVGDLCDCGNENLKTLEFLYSLGSSFHSVFGNHDIWLYRYLAFGEKSDCWVDDSGHNETLDEISGLAFEEKKKYADWLSDFPYVIETGRNVICHNFVCPSVIKERINGLDIKTITLKNCLSSGLFYSLDYDEDMYSRNIADFILKKERFPDGDFGVFTDESFEKTFHFLKRYYMGHTINLDGIHNYRNVYMIDTGAFVEKEKYGTAVDGFLTLVRIDEK